MGRVGVVVEEAGRQAGRQAVLSYLVFHMCHRSWRLETVFCVSFPVHDRLQKSKVEAWVPAQWRSFARGSSELGCRALDRVVVPFALPRFLGRAGSRRGQTFEETGGEAGREGDQHGATTRGTMRQILCQRPVSQHTMNPQ